MATNKKKIMVSEVPFLMAQWDFEKNLEFDPNTITAGSNKRPFWKCKKCGYSWQASAKSRYTADGRCPCCESNKAIQPGINDVLTHVPELTKYIDPDKNDFDEILHEGLNSSKRIYLKCPDCGNEWNTEIRSQIKKDSGKYAIVGCDCQPGFTTVQSIDRPVRYVSDIPHLIRFWNIKKNTLDPDKTTATSSKSAWWKCPDCGYEWESPIKERLRTTGKCPCCELNIVIIVGINDVFTRFPMLKDTFNFEKNKDVDISSLRLRDAHNKYWWKCPDCGHEWYSALASRTRYIDGNIIVCRCQQCSTRDITKITPVASIPKLAKYWDFKENKKEGLDINLTSAYSIDVAHWHCKKCGYKWSSSIKSRMNAIDACPCCDSGKAIVTGINDVLTVIPDFADIYDFKENEAAGIDIHLFGIASKKVVHYHCHKCNYEWDGTICSRIIKTKDSNTISLRACPSCSNNRKRNVPYSQDHPELIPFYNTERNNVPLENVTSQSARTDLFWWTCPDCGNDFESRIHSMIGSIKNNSTGCPFCAHLKITPSNSFAGKFPELLGEYSADNIIDPYFVFPSSKTIVTWECQNGHTWNASFLVRSIGKGKCPVCNHIRVVKGENSFADIYGYLVPFYSPNNLKAPDEIFYTSRNWVKWICPDCNEEYGAYISDMVNGNATCPYCSGRKAIPGKTSFAALHPDLMDEWDTIANYCLVDPDTILDSCKQNVWWTCSRNSDHNYQMSPANRLLFQKRHRDPCPYCKGRRRKKRFF